MPCPSQPAVTLSQEGEPNERQKKGKSTTRVARRDQQTELSAYYLTSYHDPNWQKILNSDVIASEQLFIFAKMSTFVDHTRHSRCPGDELD